MGRDAQLPEQL